MELPRIRRIQRFSPDDGPGIRTTVFFGGCPLRCAWCHNPECLTGAPAADDLLLTPEALLAQVERDRRYYRQSGGGLTLSGGEPLLYPDYCAAVLALAREKEISAAVDTSGAVPWPALEAVLPYGPLLLYDLKAFSAATHRKWTGADNGRILENLNRLAAAGADYWVSIPVAEEVNAGELPQLAELLKDLPRQPALVRLLPCHDYGRGKYAACGLPEPPRLTAPTPARLRSLAAVFTERGMAVRLPE